jgi:hypothetical protein
MAGPRVAQRTATRAYSCRIGASNLRQYSRPHSFLATYGLRALIFIETLTALDNQHAEAFFELLDPRGQSRLGHVAYEPLLGRSGVVARATSDIANRG